MYQRTEATWANVPTKRVRDLHAVYRLNYPSYLSYKTQKIGFVDRLFFFPFPKKYGHCGCTPIDFIESRESLNTLSKPRISYFLPSYTAHFSH